MAMFDWNGDGKKDFMYDLIEYEGFMFYSEEREKSRQKHTHTNRNSSGGISTFGAVVITLLGMFGSGAICMALNIDSGIVILILWIVFALLLFFVYSVIKK